MASVAVQTLTASSMAAHKRLRTMASKTSAVSNSSQDCSICLNSIAVCPFLILCYLLNTDFRSPANHCLSRHVLTHGISNASSRFSPLHNIPSSSVRIAVPAPISKPMLKNPPQNGRCCKRTRRKTKPRSSQRQRLLPTRQPLARLPMTAMPWMSP